ELERVDRELLKQLARRAKLVAQLARSRHAQGEQPWNAADDQQALQRAAEVGASPLSPSAVNVIFREILSGCRALVKPLRVAYLGPEYSYSHLATRARFGTAVDAAPVQTIGAVFEE